MKKIYYLFAFVALAFTACQKEPALHSVLPLAPGSTYQTLAFTLQQSDYQLLSTGYPKTSFTFDNDADAKTYIPQILNSKYPNLANGSTAAVTYTKSALYFSGVVDSAYLVTTAGTDSSATNSYYALTAADYLLLPGNKYTDFSVAQLIQWLPYKFPSVPNNTLKVVSWTIYPTGSLPAPPLSFLYSNGVWKQIYQVTPAEYTALGIGKYDEFTTAVLPTSQTLGALVSSDVTVMDTVKTGDIVYVSYNYYVSSKLDYQKVTPLYYDGNHFVAPIATTTGNTLNFIKTNGTWGFVQPLPVITVTITAKDPIADPIVEKSGFGTTTQVSDLTSYGDFDASWTTANLDGAFIAVLTAEVTTPQQGYDYNVVYPKYSGGDVNTTLVFIWDGTKWVAQQ